MFKANNQVVAQPDAPKCTPTHTPMEASQPVCVCVCLSFLPAGNPITGDRDSKTQLKTKI